MAQTVRKKQEMLELPDSSFWKKDLQLTSWLRLPCWSGAMWAVSLLAGLGHRSCLAVTFLGGFKAYASGIKPVLHKYNTEHTHKNQNWGRDSGAQE